MIPEVIHYCWFGGNEKSDLSKRCIESWRRVCPSYEIVEWNESNFDVNANGYVKYCYENKLWAFLSDYVRLAVVYEHGGLYLDTDVELLRSPDFLMGEEAFFSFQENDLVNTGQGFGACKGNACVKAMLDEYDAIEPDADGRYPTQACPALNTAPLVKMGLALDGSRQTVGGALILPIEYMNPYDDPTGRMRKTENTLSVHWYSKSWISKKAVLRSKLTRPFHRLFGKNCFSFLKRKQRKEDKK